MMSIQKLRGQRGLVSGQHEALLAGGLPWGWGGLKAVVLCGVLPWSDSCLYIGGSARGLGQLLSTERLHWRSVCARRR